MSLRQSSKPAQDGFSSSTMFGSVSKRRKLKFRRAAPAPACSSVRSFIITMSDSPKIVLDLLMRLSASTTAGQSLAGSSPSAKAAPCGPVESRFPQIKKRKWTHATGNSAARSAVFSRRRKRRQRFEATSGHNSPGAAGGAASSRKGHSKRLS